MTTFSQLSTNLDHLLQPFIHFSPDSHTHTHTHTHAYTHAYTHTHTTQHTLSLPLSQALISRDYRGDVEMTVIDKFLPMVLDMEEEGNMSPILIHEKVTFVYIKHNNLYCILIKRMGKYYMVIDHQAVVYAWCTFC